MDEYTSKKDISGRVHGIELYHPGEPSVQQLKLGATSGTSLGKPTVSISRVEEYLFVAPFRKIIDTDAHGGSVMRLAPSPDVTYTVITMKGNELENKRFCTVTPEDLQLETFGTLLLDFAPTELTSHPSLLIHMIDTLQKHSDAKEVFLYVKEHIKRIGFGGEKLTQTQTDIFQKLFPNAAIHNTYGLSEVSLYMATTCPILGIQNPADYCISPSHTNLIDIKDPDETGFGEIVITTAELGKYRTGDMGKIEGQDCACGSKRKLTILGRIDYDIIHCAGATFLIDEIDRVFALLSEYVSDYLVEVSETIDDQFHSRGQVHILAVPTKRLKEDPLAYEKLLSIFEVQLSVTPSRTLGALIKEDIFAPSTLALVENIQRGVKKVRLRQAD